MTEIHLKKWTKKVATSERRQKKQRKEKKRQQQEKQKRSGDKELQKNWLFGSLGTLRFVSHASDDSDSVL